MSDELLPSGKNNRNNESEGRHKLLVALLFLLLSFSCVFCSSQSALWFIDRDRIEASMRSLLTADYGLDPLIALAPLSGDIEAEAVRDEELLALSQTPVRQGIAVAVLPNPLPTPIMTPTPMPVTPVPRPTAGAPAPTSPPAEATESPLPTPISPTPPSTAVPPTPPPASPTVVPPTPTGGLPSPTSVPPTAPPPTSPPSTSSPPTSPPPTPIPPTSPPPTPTDIPPTVAFRAVAFSVNEADGFARITVNLSYASGQTVRVSYATTGLTATPGNDYADVSGTLTFAAGQTSRTFDVPIINDNLTNEEDEYVRLTLSNPANATLGAPNLATLIIVDDDGEPSVQFNQPAYRVDEGVGSAVITVTLSAPSVLEVTVVYSSTDIRAKAGEDYTGVTDTLTFASEQLAVTFTVPITDDNLTNEGDEQVRLTLSAPMSATLGAPNPATLTIEDNDPQPEVEFVSADISVAENAGLAVVPVSLSASSAMTVTVTYATGGGTATGGDDYVATSGALEFPPTQTSLTFTITINDDTLPEPNEAVELILSNPISATLGATNPATLTITDNDRPSGTPPSCSGLYPSGEPNVGEADGSFARIACEVGLIIDLQTPIIVSGDGNLDYDLVYYEAIGVNDMGTVLIPPEMIYLDLVTVSIAQDLAGSWIDVFVWGDNVPDTNTNLMRSSPIYTDTGTASDNAIIRTPPLVGPSGLETGIQIDVDNSPTGIPVPAGNYRYVRIFSPAGGDNDGPEIDALEVLP